MSGPTIRPPANLQADGGKGAVRADPWTSNPKDAALTLAPPAPRDESQTQSCMNDMGLAQGKPAGISAGYFRARPAFPPPANSPYPSSHTPAAPAFSQAFHPRHSVPRGDSA